MTGPSATSCYRAVFISDVHLGTRSAQATELLEFLRSVEVQTLYLVGDIIDFWKVRRGPHWPQSHNDVLQKILRKARKGTRVVFIPGNHDDGIREVCGMDFGGIEVRRDAIHQTAGPASGCWFHRSAPTVRGKVRSKKKRGRFNPSTILHAICAPGTRVREVFAIRRIPARLFLITTLVRSGPIHQRGNWMKLG